MSVRVDGGIESLEDYKVSFIKFISFMSWELELKGFLEDVD
jgi:hypothetical protein